MEYLPIASIIYGLLLFALSIVFNQYTAREFAMLFYGIAFLGLGIGFYLLQIGMDLGLPTINNEQDWVRFFSVMFFATAVHIFFKTIHIIKFEGVEDKQE